jgi:hypothetical protein
MGFSTFVRELAGLLPLVFLPLFHIHSPASKSTKVWTTFYLSLLTIFLCFPERWAAFSTGVSAYIAAKPAKAAVIALSIGVPLKYLQRKLRFARVNALKMKYGFTDDPKTYEDMTVEQAQEVERNMAEVSIAIADMLL